MIQYIVVLVRTKMLYVWFMLVEAHHGVFCRPVLRHWSWIWRQWKRRSLCCWKNTRISSMSRWLSRSRSPRTGSVMLLKDFSSFQGNTDWLIAYTPWVPVLFLIHVRSFRLILCQVPCHITFQIQQMECFIYYILIFTLQLLYLLYCIYLYWSWCLSRHLIKFIVKLLALKMETGEMVPVVDSVKGAVDKISSPPPPTKI